jgi:hypothetical protein
MKNRGKELNLATPFHPGNFLLNPLPDDLPLLFAQLNVEKGRF